MNNTTTALTDSPDRSRFGSPPRASVILPVFNGERYLSEAINSVLRQSFSNFELLLIDDGSTDKSIDVIKRFANSDSRCVVVSRENRGLVRTLNEGIQLSRADILFRMDADDRSHPMRFERQIQFLNDNPHCVAVGTDVMLVDPLGAPLCRLGVPQSHEEIDTQHMLGVGGAAINHPSVAYRKSAILQVGMYREEFQHAEDFDLFLRLAELGQVCNLPDTLLDYRQHLQSIGYTRSNAQGLSIARALADANLRRGVGKARHGHGSGLGDHDTSFGAVYRKWAWWALSAGNVDTARKYTLKAIKHSPFNKGNLKLIACAIRGC